MLKKIMHGIFVVACFNAMALYGAAAESERKVEAAVPCVDRKKVTWKEVTLFLKNNSSYDLRYSEERRHIRKGLGSEWKKGKELSIRLYNEAAGPLGTLYFDPKGVVEKRGNVKDQFSSKISGDENATNVVWKIPKNFTQPYVFLYLTDNKKKHLNDPFIVVSESIDLPQESEEFPEADTDSQDIKEILANLETSGRHTREQEDIGWDEGEWEE